MLFANFGSKEPQNRLSGMKVPHQWCMTVYTLLIGLKPLFAALLRQIQKHPPQFE